MSDDLVWYPPGPAPRATRSLTSSFEFFSRTTGLTLSKKVRDLVVLPDAARPAAEQELDSAAGERPLEQRRSRGGAGERR